MELNRIRLATLASARTVHWISDVRLDGTAWRFDVYDSQKRSIAHFRYKDRHNAEKARGQMFSVLEAAIDATFRGSSYTHGDLDGIDETG
jgi:hypothetical protein